MGYLSFLVANPRFLSFGFGLNVFLALGQTFYISLYNSEIRSALSLSHGELAGIYGVATIVGSVCVLVLGRLLDRIDLRLFTGATTIFVAFGCWVFGQANNVVSLFIGILIIRFTAQGLWGTSAQVSMARYFDADRGKAAAVANTGYALGFAAFPLIGTYLLSAYDWRTAWNISGWFVLLAVLPLILIQLRGHGERHKYYEKNLAELTEGPIETQIRQWTMSEVLKDVRFWLIQPAMIAVPSIVFAIQFHQLYLVELKGWDLTRFAGSYSLFAVMSLAATLVGGVLVDRYGSRRLINAYLWPLIPALLVLGLMEHTSAIFFLMALTGFTFGLGLVVFVTLWAEMYGTKYMGAIRSFNVFFNVMVASCIMVLTGWLIDQKVSLMAMCNGGIALVFCSLVLFAIERRITLIRPK